MAETIIIIESAQPQTSVVTVTFSALDTAIKAETYAYDFMFDSGSEITRLLEGKFLVPAGVTV